MEGEGSLKVKCYSLLRTRNRHCFCGLLIYDTGEKVSQKRGKEVSKVRVLLYENEGNVAAL